MSVNSELVRFEKDIKSNAALRNDVKKIGMHLDKLAELAVARGYKITKADLDDVFKQKKAKLSDEALKKVAAADVTTTATTVEVVQTEAEVSTSTTTTEVEAEAEGITIAVAVAVAVVVLT